MEKSGSMWKNLPIIILIVGVACLAFLGSIWVMTQIGAYGNRLMDEGFSIVGTKEHFAKGFSNENRYWVGLDKFIEVAKSNNITTVFYDTGKIGAGGFNEKSYAAFWFEIGELECCYKAL